MQDEILEQVRTFAQHNQLRVYVLARKPRLRIRLEGGLYGEIHKLEQAVPVAGYRWHCTSGGGGQFNFSLWKDDSNPWKEAAEAKKQADIESGRRFPKQNESRCPFPHCDSRVLHAPGECEYCDKFPVYQYYRECLGINFTGHNDPDKSKCPAELARPLERIERWGGNRKYDNQPMLDGSGQCPICHSDDHGAVFIEPWNGGMRCDKPEDE